MCFDGFASLGNLVFTHTYIRPPAPERAIQRKTAAASRSVSQFRFRLEATMVHHTWVSWPRRSTSATRRLCIVLCVLCSHAWSSACGRVSAGALYIDAHDSSGFCALFVGAGCYMESEQKEELVPVAARYSSLIAYSECLRIDWEWTSFYQATWPRCSSCRT